MAKLICCLLRVRAFSVAVEPLAGRLPAFLPEPFL